MKNKNKNLLLTVSISTLSVVVIILLIIFIPKIIKNINKPTYIKGCISKKDFQFSDIKAVQCPVNNNSGNGNGNTPAYIIFLRHCEQQYKNNSDPCTYCPGSSDTNDCYNRGIDRSWNVGNWLSCFSKNTNTQIGGIITQKHGPNTNNRPQTTAAIIYQSLQNNGINTCYSLIKRLSEGDRSKNLDLFKSTIQNNQFNNKIAVVVWDHGDISELITSIGGKKLRYGWDNCCYDKVAVMNGNSKQIEEYNMKSLNDNDICNKKCNAPNIYKDCEYKNYKSTKVCQS